MSFNFMAVFTEVIFEPKGKEPKYFEEKQILSLGQELNKLILVYLIVTESKEILFKKSHIDGGISNGYRRQLEEFPMAKTGIIWETT